MCYVWVSNAFYALNERNRQYANPILHIAHKNCEVQADFTLSYTEEEKTIMKTIYIYSDYKEITHAHIEQKVNDRYVVII